MKIKIAVKELSRVLKQASSVLSGKLSIEVLKYVKIEINGVTAKAYASDLGMSIVQQFDIAGSDASSPFSFLLNAAKASKILEALASQETVQLDVQPNGVTMTSGKYSKIKLPVIDIGQFPELDAMPPATHTFKLGVLKSQIRRVEIAVPSKEGKFAKPIVHFEGTEKYLRAVATDGFRIAVVDEPSVGILKMDLPKTALALISSLPGEDISFAETETKYFFLTGKEKVIIGKRLGTFPDYRKALTITYLNHANVAPADLKTSLDLVAVAVDPDHRAIEVTVGEGKIALYTSSTEGEGEDTLEVITEGKTIKTRLNPDFIQDYLAQIDGQAFKMKQSGEKGPVCLSLNDTYQYFLMPVPEKETSKKEKASA